MHPNVRPGTRRVHGAEFKAKVLAECREPGASVAAVAMANGVNANMVRKWLEGRGLKRTGLVVPTGAAVPALTDAKGEATTLAAPSLPVMQFVPVGVTAASKGNVPGVAPATQAAIEGAGQIHVELRRGDASLAVRWPASQAQGCAAWLSELAGALLAR